MSLERDFTHAPHEAHSAVSWGAIIAGATAALALSFVLLALAAGFGLKLASPWPGMHAPTDDFTPMAGAVLIVVQVLSAALGGYLAGRLRTKWVDVHDHEVHFRDTAHGLLVWALSTLAGVVLAAGVLAPIVAHAPTMPTQVLATVDLATAQAQAQRAADLAAQVSLFMGVGLLLSAFTAAVAAGIGGLRRDEMHATFWSDPVRARGRTIPTV